MSVMIVQIGANESYTGPDLCLPGAETCAVPPLGLAGVPPRDRDIIRPPPSPPPSRPIRLGQMRLVLLTNQNIND